MKTLLCLFVLVLIGCAEPHRPVERGVHKVGVTERAYVDENSGRPIAVQLWYPAINTAQETQQNYQRAFAGFAASNAGIKAGVWPLVLLSHGDKGNRGNQSWLAEYLASHGYIVAALDHWLNTTQNNIPEETLRVWHRPIDVSVALDKLASEFHYDRDNVSALGHSSGGYTVLALAGVIYEPERMQAYCNDDDPGPACSLVDDVDWSLIDFSAASKPYRDERIARVVAMAPALGPGISKASLEAIEVPVMVISTPSDEVLRAATNAEYYRRHIPRVQWLQLDEGGHFVYLSECNAVSYWVLRFSEFDICGSQSSVDRKAVHRLLAAEVLAFLQR